VSATAPSTAISVAEAKELIESNPDALVVDVRTPAEFESVHIDGAINLPLDQVDAHLQRIVQDAGGRMILICQSGGRATQAQEKLAGAGLSEVNVMTGGMGAWVAADAPVIRGTERWSLERQIRLVAGSIVLLSVIVSIWIPAMVIVAGLMGAGLAFAALTNTCAMGMLLSRLPYNRGADCDVDSAIARLRAGTPAA
jgi:rhodanese-related sulfurtransferase